MYAARPFASIADPKTFEVFSGIRFETRESRVTLRLPSNGAATVLAGSSVGFLFSRLLS